jgi:hypothetical protein
MVNDFIIFFMAFWAMMVIVKDLGCYMGDIIDDWSKIRYRNKYMK